MRKMKTVIGVLLAIVLVFGCQEKEQEGKPEKPELHGPPIKLVYVKWSTEIASTNLVKAVLQERLGRECEIKAVSAEEMWQAVAEGKADAMVSAWLPGTHEHFYRKYRDQVENLGPNLEGTRIGLLVPDISVGRQTTQNGQHNEPYIKADSITDLPRYAGKFQRRIVGIDPQAGIMRKTRHAMEAYGLKEDFHLVEGSEQAMTRELTKAISKQQWIVVTGWYPHWMFGRWKLKFLEDPQNVFGGKEHINTIVRKGLKKDMPEAYKLLNNFHWSPEQMAHLMLWIRETKGLYPYEQALRWIETHPDQVDEWMKK